MPLPRGVNTPANAAPQQGVGPFNFNLNEVVETTTYTNTVLSDIDSNTSMTSSKLDTVNTNIGTTNTEINTTNTKLDTVNTNLGLIKTDIDTTNTKLDSVISTLGTPAQVVTSVTYTHTAVTTSTSSSTALASNTNAKFRMFQNDDTSIIIYLFFGGSASLNRGIKLLPGASYFATKSNGNLDTRVVNCIAVSGTPTLLVTEGT